MFVKHLDGNVATLMQPLFFILSRELKFVCRQHFQFSPLICTWEIVIPEMDLSNP